MLLMNQDSRSDLLKYALIGINAECDDTVREAKETIRRAEERRDILIARAREWAQGGAVGDWSVPLNEDEASSPVERTPQKNGVPANGSNGVRNTVSKDVVLKFVDEVMNDPTVDVVTQTEVKDRILAHYPVSRDYLNSLRILIIGPLNELEEQGYLELVERASAGKPNKYRKTGKRPERQESLS